MFQSLIHGGLAGLLVFSVTVCSGQETRVSGPPKSEPQSEVGSDIGAKIANENQISIELFRKIMANKAALDSIVLVDVRSDSENSVSIIPGAITKAKYEADPKKYAGKTAVCYCLSGGRSGKYVKQLKAGGQPAVDLKGSILEWCKQELPLTTPDGQPTNKVNVYDNKVPAKYDVGN